MVSKTVFSVFIVLLAMQRLWELKKSERHLKKLLKRGGREHNFRHFPAMAMLHGAWLIAMVAEVWIFDRHVHLTIALIATVVFLVGQVLRLWAMHDLGERWCARIVTLPDHPPIATGIYRYVRHPNYIGVVLEIAAAPLIHGAFFTAAVFSVLNLWLLSVRIKAEEKALYG